MSTGVSSSLTHMKMIGPYASMPKSLDAALFRPVIVVALHTATKDLCPIMTGWSCHFSCSASAGMNGYEPTLLFPLLPDPMLTITQSISPFLAYMLLLHSSLAVFCCCCCFFLSLREPAII